MPRTGPPQPKTSAPSPKLPGGDCSERGCCYSVGGALSTRCQCNDCSWCAVYRFTGRDRFGRQDIASILSRVVGYQCQRAGPWRNGKALMRFPKYGDLIVPADLLRRI